jgi:hypothetical protein
LILDRRKLSVYVQTRLQSGKSCTELTRDLEEDPLESGSSSNESDGEWSLNLADEPGERSSSEEEDSSDRGSIVEDPIARYGYGVS